MQRAATSAWNGWHFLAAPSRHAHAVPPGMPMHHAPRISQHSASTRAWADLPESLPEHTMTSDAPSGLPYGSMPTLADAVSTAAVLSSELAPHHRQVKYELLLSAAGLYVMQDDVGLLFVQPVMSSHVLATGAEIQGAACFKCHHSLQHETAAASRQSAPSDELHNHVSPSNPPGNYPTYCH